MLNNYRTPLKKAAHFTLKIFRFYVNKTALKIEIFVLKINNRQENDHTPQVEQ